ncbi:hypothetical protein Q3G72_011603 [Acer saccharum]|nr:hypothetical protein Q3G72_011603 [Acer saccharum]
MSGVVTDGVCCLPNLANFTFSCNFFCDGAFASIPSAMPAAAPLLLPYNAPSYTLALKSVSFCFSGYTESLADDIELEVPDDDYGLYAIDILDPSVVKTIFFAMLCMLMV